MKKILAVLLVLAMTMAAVPGALAEDYGHTTGPVTDVCPVNAKVAITYTISIPSSIEFGNLKKTDAPKSIPLTITVSDVMVEKNAGLKLSFNSTFKMTTTKGGELPFTLTYGSFTASSPMGPYSVPFTTIAAAGNTVTAMVNVTPSLINYAGDYNGTLNFGFEYYS